MGVDLEYKFQRSYLRRRYNPDLSCYSFDRHIGEADYRTKRLNSKLLFYCTDSDWTTR